MEISGPSSYLLTNFDALNSQTKKVLKIYNMKILRTISILSFVIAMVSCSSVKVVVDLNKDADLSRYKTYSFLSWQDLEDEIFSDGDKKLMRDAFIGEFERRGLKLVNSKGDMQVSLYVVVNNETAFSGYNDYVGGRSSGYNHYRGGWGYGYRGTTSKQQDKLVGTLIMNVYNGNSQNQVWQAIATKTVNLKSQKRDKSISRTASSVMKQFPVRPK